MFLQTLISLHILQIYTKFFLNQCSIDHLELSEIFLIKLLVIKNSHFQELINFHQDFKEKLDHHQLDKVIKNSD